MSANSGDENSPESKPERAGSVNVRRNAKGQLLPGSNLNPAGPGRGYKQQRTLFNKAVAREAARRGGVTVWDNILERSYDDPRYAKLVVERLYPVPRPDTMLHLEMNQATIVAPQVRQLEELDPASRPLLRQLIQIEAKRILAAQAARQASGQESPAVAPAGGNGSKGDGRRPRATRARSGAQNGGNGRRRRGKGKKGPSRSGNGRKR